MTVAPGRRTRSRGVAPQVAPHVIDVIDLLSTEWIETVARTTDNELRAHRVALTYSRISLHLDDLIHGRHSVRNRPPAERGGVCNANFFHFATWGTLTVSQNIGNQRPPQRLNVGLGVPLRRRLTPLVMRARAADAQVVGRALAWGQRLIFVSACSALANFSQQLAESDNFEVDRLKEHLSADATARLTSGGPFAGIDPARHVEPIARAFELYALARHAPAVARAKLVLGGNLLLTAVEQDLIDPALSFVVDLVPKHLGGALDWRVARLAERARGIPPYLSFLALQSRHEPVRRALDVAWSRVMTDQILVMALPAETLRLGRDIPPWRKDRPYFAADLRDLGERSGATGATAEAVDSVARHVRSLDRTVGNGRGSAARDWRRWDERMNFAVTLMRSRQHEETLFWRPYTEADERRIIAGELPARMGDPSALDVEAPLDPLVFSGFDGVSRGQR